MHKINIEKMPIKRLSFYVGSVLVVVIVIFFFIKAGQENSIPGLPSANRPTSFPASNEPVTIKRGSPVNSDMLPMSDEELKLLSAIPEVEPNFYIYFNYKLNIFELVINIDKPEQAEKDFNTFLNKNGISRLSVMKKIYIRKETNPVFENPSLIEKEN